MSPINWLFQTLEIPLWAVMLMLGYRPKRFSKAISRLRNKREKPPKNTNE